MDRVFGVDVSWGDATYLGFHNISQSLRDQFGKHEKKAFSLEEVAFAETTIQKC